MATVVSAPEGEGGYMTVPANSGATTILVTADGEPLTFSAAGVPNISGLGGALSLFPNQQTALLASAQMDTPDGPVLYITGEKTFAKQKDALIPNIYTCWGVKT